MITNMLDLRAVLHDLATATWSLAAIGIVLDSGLAEAIVEPRTADELAAACPALTPAQIDRVLAIAVVHGVAIADGPRYRLAEPLVPVMRSPARAVLAGDIRAHLMQALAVLGLARSDAPPSPSWSHTDAALLQAQGESSRAMPMIIKTQFPEMAALLDRPGARFLDIGTGVGELAIAACRMFGSLQVVGIDSMARPLELARENVERARLDERIELRHQSIEQLRDDGAFAGAWLPAFFIPMASLATAIRRAVDALEPGGWLVVGIPGAGDPTQRAVWGLVASLWGGPTASPASVCDMLREAGLHDVRAAPGPAWAPQIVAGVR